MRGTLKIVASVALLWGAWMSAGEAQARPRDERLEGLASEVRTLKLLRTLELTDAQLEQLYTLAQQAGELRRTFEQELEPVRAEAAERLARERDELLAGGEPAGKAERKSGKRGKRGKRGATRELRQQHQALREQMELLVEQSLDVLTDEQKARLEQLEQRHGGREARGGPERALGQVVTRLREASDEEYPEMKAKVLERHAEMMRGRGLPEQEASAETQRLDAALDGIRALDEPSFEQRREELLAGLLPDRHAAARGERGERGRGRTAKIGRWLASETTLRALAGLTGRAGQ